MDQEQLHRSDTTPVTDALERLRRLENDVPALELAFGARATIEDTTLDEVVCGEGVLVRGSAKCPSEGA